MMKCCLIVFAKEPRMGKAKMRLSSFLTQKELLELYKVFVRDALDMARKANGIRGSSLLIPRGGQAMAKAKKTGTSAVLLKEWYDVDESKSLALLVKGLKRGGSMIAEHAGRVAGAFAGALCEASARAGFGAYGK